MRAHSASCFFLYREQTSGRDRLTARRVCGVNIDREPCKLKLVGVVVDSRLIPGGDYLVQSAECAGEV